MTRPRFSVVVPTFNRRDALERTLGAYERQVASTPPFEVLVVDDGSTDGTAEWLAGFSSRTFSHQVFRQPNLGPAAARNRALRAATGEIIFFTGDDIEPEADLLVRHDAAQSSSPGEATAYFGRIDWPADLEATATMLHITGRGAQQFSFYYLEDGAYYDYRHFYTSNVSIPRAVLDREPNYFSEEFPSAAFEDAELAYRLSRHGLRLRYLPAARAYHWHHYGARSFFARQVRCGEMAGLLIGKHPATRRDLDLNLLPWTRLRSLAVQWLGSGRLRALARQLPERIEAALTLAEHLDRGSVESAEPLLLPLFRFGFLAGVAHGRYSAGVARRVEAALFARILGRPLAQHRVA
ncbi:MAG: glycosyltransferase [Thermoanaerobaculia bacterium]